MVFLNLFETSHSVLKEAFDSLEFPGFFEDSLNRDSQNSIKAVFKAFERFIDEDALEEWSLSSNVGPAIYGNGGFNRYFVYSDGTIRFSAGHASNEVRNLASELGFKVC